MMSWSARSVPRSSTRRGRSRSATPSVESQQNRGYATAAVEALVAKLRDASEVRRFVAHAPLERPESGRVVEKAGFAMVREMDDTDEVGNVLRIKEWELAV